MKESKNFFQNQRLVLIATASGLLVFSICVWGWNHKTNNETTSETINVLFSGLAFTMLIVTVLMQKEELELQRKELKDTRAEFEQQNSTMKRQRFENTFFKLIDIIETIRRTIGVGGFEVNFRALKDSIDQNAYIGRLKAEQKHEYFDLLTDIYKGLYHGQFRATMNRYFKNFFNAQNYIESSDLISNEEKEFYMDVLYSQLLNYEISLIAFHLLLSKENINNEATIAKKYRFVTRLDIGLQFTDRIPIVFQYKGFL